MMKKIFLFLAAAAISMPVLGQGIDFRDVTPEEAKDGAMRQKDPVKYHRIGEAAQSLDLNTSVLRFWEDEFPQLRPTRTPKGQRLYSEQDMALLLRIKTLLHEQGMTIDGARRVLAGSMDAPASLSPTLLPTAPPDSPHLDLLRQTACDLQDLRDMLRCPS